MEDGNKKKLINEKITGRRLTPVRILKFVIMAAVCGVVFGIAASFSGHYLDSRRQAAEESAKAAEAESSATAAMTSSDTGEASLPEASGTESETDTGESAAESSHADDGSEPETDGEDAASPGGGTGRDPEGKNADSETEDAEASDVSEQNELLPIFTDEAELDSHLMSIMSGAAELADSYLVSVTATAQTTTWFDNETEKTENFAGIVLSADEEYLLILTTCTDTDAKRLSVTFRDGTSAEAALRQVSRTDGLSILEVSITEDSIPRETLEAIVPAEYAETDGVVNGTRLIAVGAPLGVYGSCSFGNAGFISESETVMDCTRQAIYSELTSDSSIGTFITDYQGRLVGIATDEPSDIGASPSLTRIVTISSLEPVIRALMNGEKKACLGIKGVNVGGSAGNGSIPEGVYVANVFQDSPAYAAGIRRGDIIVNITDSASDRSIMNVDVLTRAIFNAEPGDNVTVSVMRDSVNDEYRQIDFDITYGERW